RRATEPREAQATRRSARRARAPRSCRRGSGRACAQSGTARMSGTGHRWLALIGIGEDGLDGLSPVARRLIADAEFIIGGARHLRLAGSPTCETLIWPSPIGEAI